jgi:hypothetical protein
MLVPISKNKEEPFVFEEFVKADKKPTGKLTGERVYE